MSNLALARARRRRDWVHQPSRESLSQPALNLLLTCQSPQSQRRQTAERASSTYICCKAIISPSPIFLPSVLSEPLNAHRASIVERFSPIHF
jgi:hypothetical protein